MPLKSVSEMANILRGKLAGSIAPQSGRDPGGMFKINLSEKVGKEAPPIYGTLNSKKLGSVSGYIQPANVDEATKLALRNKASMEMRDTPYKSIFDETPTKPTEPPKPSKPNLHILDSIVDPVSLRGYGRAITARDQRLDEFRKVDSTWNVAYNAWKSVAKQAHDEPTTRRTELADALRGGPKPPAGHPSRLGEYAHPDYIPTVQAIKYAKQLPAQFKDAIKDAQTAGNLFYTGDELASGVKASRRTERSKAIDIEIAARNVVRQGQEGIFVPPHATPAETAAILGLGKKWLANWPINSIWPNTDLKVALDAAMKAARFLHLKD